MKKIVLGAIALVILLLMGGFLFMQKDENITETELQEKFRCDRITADVLATDIYCQNSEYYYEDARNGTVIDESDFDDPRYEAFMNKSSSQQVVR
jgi:hypothetical protein